MADVKDSDVPKASNAEKMREYALAIQVAMNMSDTQKEELIVNLSAIFPATFIEEVAKVLKSVAKTEGYTFTYGLVCGDYIDGDIITEIKHTYAGGERKVAAIKNLRELTGWGLREAKEAVEILAAEGII